MQKLFAKPEAHVENTFIHEWLHTVLPTPLISYLQECERRIVGEKKVRVVGRYNHKAH